MLLFWRARQVPTVHRRWTHDLPPWARLIIVAAVVGIIFAASPGQQERVFGKAWTSLDLCQNRGIKLAAASTRLANLTAIVEAEEYVANKSKVVDRMESLASSFYQSPAQLSWPNGCTPAAAAVASARKCRDVLDCLRIVFLCLPRRKTICFTTKVPDKRAQEQLTRISEEEARLKEWRQQANSSESGGGRTVLREAEEAGSEIADDVARTIRLSLTIHTYYMALGLYCRAPLLSFRHRQWRHAAGHLFALSKTKFVLASSIILLAARPVKDALRYADWWPYLHKFTVDPCLVDRAFVRERDALAVSAAANWSALANVSVTLDTQMSGLFLNSRRMALCENPDGAKVAHPRQEDMNQTLGYYRLKPMPGTANLTTLVAMLEEVHDQPRVTTLLLALVRDRMLARTIFRTFLISIVQSIFILVWPVLGYSGVVTVPTDSGGEATKPKDSRGLLPTNVEPPAAPPMPMATVSSEDGSDDEEANAGTPGEPGGSLVSSLVVNGAHLRRDTWWSRGVKAARGGALVCFFGRRETQPAPVLVTRETKNRTQRHWLATCLIPDRESSSRGASKSGKELSSSSWVQPSKPLQPMLPSDDVSLSGRWLYEDWCLDAVRRARFRVAILQIALFLLSIAWLAYSEAWARRAGQPRANTVTASPPRKPAAGVCPADIHICSK